MVFILNNFNRYLPDEIDVRERTDSSKFINLSNNEMTHSKLGLLLKKIGDQYDWQRAMHYPLCINIRKKVASLYGLNVEQVLLSSGTDNAIAQILATFSNNKTLVLQYPNYFNYENYAKLFAMKIIKINFYKLNEQDLFINFCESLANCQNAIVVITSPHVYSGSCISNNVIRRILDYCLEYNHLMLIDEAYYSFSNQDNIPLLNEQYPNLIILRSFSKAFGVAGMRIGGIFAHQKIITVLKKTGILGCINDAAIHLLSLLLDHYDEILEIRADINCNREWVAKRVEQIYPHGEVLKSYGNFITFFVDSMEVSDSIFKFMFSRNILIKQLTEIDQFSQAIRVTVSDRIIMNKLIECFESWSAINSAMPISENNQW